jgi:hypothetical protein
MIYEATFSDRNKKEFEHIQYRAWETAIKLNPKASKFGFNINSTYQCELYPEYDYSPKEEWDPGNLTWDNFIKELPEYEDFCYKFNLYQGCTMVSRPFDYAHRHGNGEHTITYPLQHCDGVQVEMVTPHNLAELNKNNIHCLEKNEPYDIDLVYTCSTGKPFILKANHFHRTPPETFKTGQTIFTIWHELFTFTPKDVSSLIRKLST